MIMESNKQRQQKTKSTKNVNKKESNTEDSQTNFNTKKPLQPSPLTSNIAISHLKPSLSRKNAGTNWLSQLGVTNSAEELKSKDACQPPKANTNDTTVTEEKPKLSRNHRKKLQRSLVVAMDCEMVGIGPMGTDDMLARVSIVNRNGEVLLDKFVKPLHPVTDYRTSVSGIRPHDIENAEDFEKVQDEVVQLLQGKILVGHGIRNDMAVLYIRHPNQNIRDTSRYRPLARLVSNGRTPSLKRLSQSILGVEIQTGEHNSVEDARAAMNIYNRLAADWENYLKRQKRSK